MQFGTEVKLWLLSSPTSADLGMNTVLTIHPSAGAVT